MCSPTDVAVALEQLAHRIWDDREFYPGQIRDLNGNRVGRYGLDDYCLQRKDSL